MPRFSGLFYASRFLPCQGAVPLSYFVKHILQQLLTNLHIYSIPLGKKYAILLAFNLISSAYYITFPRDTAAACIAVCS